jgi:tetratricopeptide (TPR) repeat protein
LLVCGIVGVAADAGAQGARPDVDQRGRDLFQEGRIAYDAGDFEGAYARFRAAYELSGRAELLYNIGISADRLGRLDEALDAYRAYVAALPEAENAVSVRDRIAVLAPEEAARSTEPVAAPPPEPAPEPAAPPPEPVAEPAPEPRDEAPLPVAPIVVAGAGVVVLGIGGVFGALASSGEDDYASAPVTTADEVESARAKLSDAETHATTANVLFVLGGVATAAGLGWLVYELASDDGTSVEASAWIERETAGVRVRGAWGAR